MARTRRFHRMNQKLIEASTEWSRFISLKYPTIKGGVLLPSAPDDLRDLMIRDLMDPEGIMMFDILKDDDQQGVVLVDVGENILRDQIIGREKGRYNVYSSVSGTVEKVEETKDRKGREVIRVYARNDHRYKSADKPFEAASFKEMSREEIIARVLFGSCRNKDLEDGYVGAELEGAFKAGDITEIIINGLDKEPLETVSYRLLMEDSWRIMNGIRILQYLFESAEVKLCLEYDRQYALEPLLEYFEQAERSVKIVTVRNKYPQQDPRLMASTISGKKISREEPIFLSGVLVFSVDDIIAISRSVTQARPTQRQIISVSGDMIPSPRTLRVRIGTSVKDILKGMDLEETENLKIIADGSMSGTALEDADVPVTGETSSLYVISEKNAYLRPETACIHCGRCAQVCPVGLRPYEMDRLYFKREWKRMELMGARECLECGCCTYICPAARLLTDRIRESRRMSLDRSRLKEIVRKQRELMEKEEKDE